MLADDGSVNSGGKGRPADSSSTALATAKKGRRPYRKKRAREEEADGGQSSPASDAGSPLATKELSASGRQQVSLKKEKKGPRAWSAKEDCRLVDGMQTLNDYQLVSAVVFSSLRSPEDIRQRWLALLYDEKVAAEASTKLLSYEPVRRIPWSAHEEEILVRSFATNDFNSFQTVLEANRHHFHSSRTAKNLKSHYAMIKNRPLPLPPIPAADDFLSSLSSSSSSASLTSPSSETLSSSSSSSETLSHQYADSLKTEAEAESVGAPVSLDEMIELDFEQLERRLLSAHESDEGHEQEKSRLFAHRRAVRRAEAAIRLTEKELENAKRLDPASSELNYLGVIRGAHIRYEIRSRVVVIGRASPDAPVDVDLSLEGDARKVSRRSALLEFKFDGNFHLRNVSSKPLFVNGRPIMPGQLRRLPLDCPLISIGGISVILDVNKPLWHQIQQQLC